MKHLFLYILILFSFSHTLSQEIKVKELYSPYSNEYEDFEFLKNELKNKNIVMLGELTHRYDDIFAMKTRIIEYLHQELKYTTIAMEAPLYDIWSMNTRGFSKKGFNNSIWGVWSNSPSFQRLVKYIDKHQIKVIGFDPQIKNSEQFIDDLYSFCSANNIKFHFNKNDLGILIEGIIETAKFEEYDITFKQFKQEINRIIVEIENLPQENHIWIQSLKGLFSCSESYITDEFKNDTINSDDHSNPEYNIRDKQMANNLLSYINRHENEKIIVWADNIHILNNNKNVKDQNSKHFVSMGTHIKKALKNHVYSLATLHGDDSLYINDKWYTTPIINQSFEGILSDMNSPYLFISSNQDAMKNEYQSRILSFINFYRMRLDELHDGYVFLKNTHSKIKLEDKIDANAVIIDNNKTKKISQKSKIVRILDSVNHEPLPYVNVYSQEHGIYRVSDENGYVNFPKYSTILPETKISISFIGYETRSLNFKDMNTSIYLSPSFETLNEIVLTAELTPKEVLNKVIQNIDKNHPTSTFNYLRYCKAQIANNDKVQYDLDFITKDYNQGYETKNSTTYKVEEIRWNIQADKDKYQYCTQFFNSWREDPLRYRTILHKRKYKKFDLKFSNSNHNSPTNSYVIDFTSERNTTNYTNSVHPTKYSGKVFIEKESFAVLKIEEKWESTLDKDEIGKYFEGLNQFKNITKSIITEERITEYQKQSNNKYCATKYFIRQFQENTNSSQKVTFKVLESNSSLFNFNFKTVEEIPYEFEKKKLTRLDRVKYSSAFWNTFNKTENKIIEK